MLLPCVILAVGRQKTRRLGVQGQSEIHNELCRKERRIGTGKERRRRRGKRSKKKEGKGREKEETRGKIRGEEEKGGERRREFECIIPRHRNQNITACS